MLKIIQHEIGTIKTNLEAAIAVGVLLINAKES